jgi:hypothetical protein
MSSYSSFFLTGSDFFFSGFFCFGGCIVEEDCPRELFVACFVGGGCFGDAWEGMSSLSPPELNGSGGDGSPDCDEHSPGDDDVGGCGDLSAGLLPHSRGLLCTMCPQYDIVKHIIECLFHVTSRDL